jgi:hypothetical protein
MDLRRRLSALIVAFVATLGIGWMWFAPSASAQNVGAPSSSPPGAVGGAVKDAPTTTTTVPEEEVDPEEEAKRLGPLKIKVAVYMMSIGKPDIGSGLYTADFYLVMHCNRKCDPSGFEVINGKITLLDKQDESDTMRVFRVNANLTAPLELRRYPFDRHTLSIQIEDRLRPVSQLLYVPQDQSKGFDPSVQVPGWVLDKSSAVARVSKHHYPVFDKPYDDYSQYVYDIDIGRAPLAAFMKVLFPALAIMATAFFGLALRPDRAVNRLGIHTGTLTAAILFHLNVTSAIPATPYLVDADKFMLGNYVGLVASVLSTVLMMVRYESGTFTEEEREARGNAVWRRSLFIVPSIWLIAQLMVWLIR